MQYDVIVVGAGHAGSEAALAAARMGRRTLVLTLNLANIGHMPCNCSVGGPAKGHVVREVDALGGEMAVNTDHTLTHMRLLNESKGPAVQALRAQADKRLYQERMGQVLRCQPNLDLRQETVAELLIDRTPSSNHAITGPPVSPDDPTTRRPDDPRPSVIGVRCESGAKYYAPAVVVTTGTFLRGLCHIGEEKTAAGRHGEAPAITLSDNLRTLGFQVARFKTGTTPRIRKGSIDFSRTTVQPSDPEPEPFSYLHDRLEQTDLLPAWQTATTEETHRVIRQNLHRSAMYGGHIEGVGPRYCPSIEDKVVRFPEKASHGIFLEQEGWDTDWIYVQGMSTSLPAEVQLAFLHSIPGLEECEMIRPGYAVEYDCVLPTQLHPWLETRLIRGLFHAGQLNGTSGYEEAAGQGLIAGINAARHAAGEPPWVPDRAESYLGVMLDDLVTKGTFEPYRLLTSRAEHRLLLRHDNADLRLTKKGRELGLVDDRRWSRFSERVLDISAAECILGKSGREALKRPEVTTDTIRESDSRLRNLPRSALRQVEIEVKYAGYITHQQALVEKHRRLEERVIPEDFDFGSVRALSNEGREKLRRVRPLTVGQASRIPGVTPADIGILLVALEPRRRAAVKEGV